MQLSKTFSALLAAATLALAAPAEIHTREAQSDLAQVDLIAELTSVLNDKIQDGDVVKDIVKAVTALLPGGLGNLVPRDEDVVKGAVKAVTAALPGGLGNLVSE
ncbi:hypothetical protein IMZ48_06410 [Candidatus Bathyarchaeota archaeon]|nr:hypothetical protein [Candidatus Bathyarchaeota archaeon]